MTGRNRTESTSPMHRALFTFGQAHLFFLGIFGRMYEDFTDETKDIPSRAPYTYDQKKKKKKRLRNIQSNQTSMLNSETRVQCLSWGIGYVWDYASKGGG